MFAYFSVKEKYSEANATGLPPFFSAALIPVDEASTVLTDQTFGFVKYSLIRVIPTMAM